MIEHLIDQCNSVNLGVNSKNTKERVLSFSKTYAVCDHIFIAGTLIDEVEKSNIFSDDLKWHDIIDCSREKPS